MQLSIEQQVTLKHMRKRYVDVKVLNVFPYSYGDIEVNYKVEVDDKLIPFHCVVKQNGDLVSIKKGEV